MTRLGAFAALAALSLMTGCGAAFADGVQCGEPKAVLEGLRQAYGEVPAFTFSVDGGREFTVTVSPKGTFSQLFAYEGKLCMGGYGDHWQAVAPLADAPKAAPGSLPDAPALLEHGMILIRLNAPAS